MESKMAHILVLPFPAQGHILPLIDLLHRLCLGLNLRFTVAVTPGNATLFRHLVESHPSVINIFILPPPSHPSLPSDLENLREIGGSFTFTMIAAMKQLSPHISLWFRSQTEPPVAIIYDFLLGAPASPVPSFAYYSTGAFAVSVIEYCWRREYIREMESIDMNGLPGSPSFKLHELPPSFTCYVKNDPQSETLKDAFLSNMNADGYIISTFKGIEDKHVSHIAQEKGHDRVYCVASPSLQGLEKKLDSVPSWKMGWLFDWLDGCPSESVIYVCFGSQKFMSEEQMRGIAGGLEESGKRFVWVVKSSPRNGRVPEGFEERMREEGRGIVVKEWAPQRRILGHKAVGVFLSHCGWNSTLEGIQCGVRFLTWPMQAEQYLNAWLLEKDLGVGARVCEGCDSIPDPKSLGRVIRLWDAEAEDVNAAKAMTAALKRKADAAIVDGGSTVIDIRRLANHFSHLAAEGL